MVTGAIKNKVDKIWTDLWAGGITNPLTVIEQLTYLMFIRSLDEKEMETEELEKHERRKAQQDLPTVAGWSGDAVQEGNGKTRVDAKAKVSYWVDNIFCGETVPSRTPSYGSFRMQKIAADGTVTEIPGSEATFDVSREYLAAHKAPAGPFKV